MARVVALATLRVTTASQASAWVVLAAVVMARVVALATVRVTTASQASAWVALVAAVMVRVVALATTTTAAVVPASAWVAAAKPQEKVLGSFLLPVARPCHSSRLRFMAAKFTNRAIPALLICPRHPTFSDTQTNAGTIHG